MIVVGARSILSGRQRRWPLTALQCPEYLESTGPIILTLSGREARMNRLAAVVVSVAFVALSAAPAWAFNCPVVIKQAEDLIKKAEAAKLTPDTRPLLEEARKQLAEARAHHEKAKTKRDHGDAVRKAKVAAAFAEEALALQTP